MALEHSRLLAASLTAAVLGASCSTSGESSTPSANQDPTGAQPPVAQRETQDPQNLEAQMQRERNQALVESYLQAAQSLRRNGDLAAAKRELLKAKEYAPANPEVLSLLSAVQAELGEPIGTQLSWSEEQLRLRTIGEERARSDVQSAMQRAKDHVEAKRYTLAIEDLRVAALVIEAKNDMNWGDLPAQVQAMQSEASSRYDEAQRQDQAKLNAQLQEVNRRRESEAYARKVDRVEGYLLKAQEEFSAKHFEAARDLAQKAHDLMPEHQLAQEMLAAARKAARQGDSDAWYQQRAIEIRKMLETQEELKNPQTDVLVTNETVWDRAQKRTSISGQSVTVSPEDAKVAEKVQTKTVGPLSFNADTGNYVEVLKVLQAVTEVQILVTPAARTKIDEGPKFEGSLSGNETLENVLNALVYRNPNLSWRVKHGLVVVGDSAEGLGDAVTEIYSVRDILLERTDFLPPTIMTIPGDTPDETPRSGSEKEEKRPAMLSATLVELLKAATGPKSKDDQKIWEQEGNKMDVEETGLLIVTAPATVQKSIAAALRDMRRFQTSIVTIDSKFLTISRNFLQEVGIDFRGLGGSGNKGDIVTLDDSTNGLVNNTSRGQDNGGTGDPAANPLAGAFFNDGGDGDLRARTENYFSTDLGKALSPTGGLTAGWTLIDDLQLNMILRAVEKRSDAEVVNSQILSIVNNGRGHVAVINQTSYVRDFDVEVAQAAFIADPKVDVIQDGLVLDVLPIILNDRKYILLNLTPTVAELQRPIPTFTTSLAGSTLPVTIQLPDLTVTQFATTVKVPDGGTVLLGGLRQVLTKERRAEIPLLASLPLLSLLFKQEGSADENRNLMVMVRAQVTDVIEEPVVAR
jgi:tetratricopeptide (TPR) repeat protein